jgi:hypothetical protein
MKPEIFYSRCLSGVVQYKLKRTPIKKEEATLQTGKCS